MSNCLKPTYDMCVYKGDNVSFQSRLKSDNVAVDLTGYWIQQPNKGPQ